MANKPIYLYEIGYYDTADSTEKVLRLATKGYVTKPTDSPSNTGYLGELDAGGTFASYMFGNNRTTGASSAGFGELIIANAHRKFDYLLGNGFDGRSFRVLRVADRATPYTDAVVVFTGVVEQVEFSVQQLRVLVRDSLYALAVPAQTATFAGDNVDANGIEGSSSLLGKIKPYVYGKVFNVSPPLVNSSSLMYAVNFDDTGTALPVASFDAVRDGENDITLDTAIGAGGDFATPTLLAAAAIGAGKYATCLAYGVFRLNTAPTFDVTCDVTEGASAATRTPAQVAYRMLTDRMATAPSFTSGTLAAMDAKISAVVGIYVDDGRTFLTAVNEVLSPLGIALVGTVAGAFSFVRLEAPGTYAGEIKANAIYRDGFDLVANGDDNNGLPPWQYRVNHSRNYTVHTESQAAGAAITSGRVEFSKREYRVAIAESAAIKTAFLTSGVYEVNTLLTAAADADTEATRQLALRGGYRRMMRIPTALGDIIDQGVTQRFTYAALDMDNGWDGVIIGYEYDFAKNETTYLAFGS